MAFYVGQKVVAVKGDPVGAPPPRIEKGMIFTISEIFHDGIELMLQLVEARFDGAFDLETGLYWSPGHQASSFRPITERKTSIEIFKAMLYPSKQEVEA